MLACPSFRGLSEVPKVREGAGQVGSHSAYSVLLHFREGRKKKEEREWEGGAAM